MKKPIKITLLVLAAITVITVIASVVMLNAVSGDDLFYIDSTLGSIYAVSYRWVCLVSGILILFWALFMVGKRREIAAKLSEWKRPGRKTADDVMPTTPTMDAGSASAVLCTKCNRQVSAKSKFCPFCGEPVASSANGKEADS